MAGALPPSRWRHAARSCESSPPVPLGVRSRTAAAIRAGRGRLWGVAAIRLPWPLVTTPNQVRGRGASFQPRSARYCRKTDDAHLALVVLRSYQRAEILENGVDVAGVRHLGTPGLPGLGDYGVVGYGAVEVQVTVVGGLVEPRQVLPAFDEPAEPRMLEAGKVSQSPSSGIVEGGTDRVANCSESRPSHFISKVIR